MRPARAPNSRDDGTERRPLPIALPDCGLRVRLQTLLRSGCPSLLGFPLARVQQLSHEVRIPKVHPGLDRRAARELAQEIAEADGHQPDELRRSNTTIEAVESPVPWEFVVEAPRRVELTPPSGRRFEG
jgi:hypothetical protein